MKNEHLKNQPINEDEDPLIAAYRMTGPKNLRGFFRVRRSELLRDPSLTAFSQSNLAQNFDQAEILSRKPETFHPANRYIEKKIRAQLVPKEVHKHIRKERMTLASLPKDLSDIKSMMDPEAQKILALVTEDLKSQGLWKDEDDDLTMTEAFPMDQTKVDSRLLPKDQKAMREGIFLEDSDLTSNDLVGNSMDLNASARVSQGFAVPLLNNLMRASPRDLYHQVARRMIESGFFDSYPEQDWLYRVVYLCSKGVEDEGHFSVLMGAGLEKVFGHYSFEQFRIDRISARRLIRPFIEQFFFQNPAITARLKLRPEVEKRDVRNFWSRFDSVWAALTAKQKEALELVYMSPDALSREEVAKILGISLNSLASRLKTAVSKFKNEFHELIGMTPKRIPLKNLASAITHNGLWRYQSAAVRARLDKIDLKTNLRVKDIAWKQLPKSRGLDAKATAKIKAEIIENCPIPHFHETEYFDGMKPTILSFSRRPGNLGSNDSDASDEEGFRDL